MNALAISWKEPGRYLKCVYSHPKIDATTNYHHQ